MKTYQTIAALALLVVLIFLTGCEYDKNDVYFEDVEKPEKKEIIFNLANLPSNSTIYIYQETKLQYNLNLPNGTILKLKYSLDNKELNPFDSYITLDCKGYEREVAEKLLLEVEVESDSESIAGKLGLENYIGSFEYQIVFIPNAKLGLQNITHIKNKDDYFELKWDKPQLAQYTVDKYRVTYYHNRTKYVKEIANIDSPSFVDTQAVFGYVYYTIETIFKEDFREPWIENHTAIVNEFPKNSVKFEYTGLNSGRISWPKNEYKSKYAFALGYYGDIVYEGLNNYFDIEDMSSFAEKNAQNFFPFNHHWVELYVIPMDAKDLGRNKPIHFDEVHCPALITMDRTANQYTVCADVLKNITFVMNGNGIWSFHSKTLEPITNNTIGIENPSLDRKFFCSELSSNLIITNDKWIDLLSYDFQTHKIVQFESDEELNYQYAFFGTNDVVFIRPYTYISEDTKGFLYAYDVHTKQLITTLMWDNKWDDMTVSRDGKYVCIYNQMKLSVYEFADNQFSLYFEQDLPNQGENVYDPKNLNFNENDSHSLIVSLIPGMKYSEMYTINIQDGTKSERKRSFYISSDPYTGNILANNATVFAPTLTSEISSLKNSSADYLIDKWIMKSVSGDQVKFYCLDITNYLIK